MSHIPLLPPIGLMLFIVGLLFLIYQLSRDASHAVPEWLAWAIFITVAVASCAMVVVGFQRGW